MPATMTTSAAVNTAVPSAPSGLGGWVQGSTPSQPAESPSTSRYGSSTEKYEPSAPDDFMPTTLMSTLAKPASSTSVASTAATPSPLRLVNEASTRDIDEMRHASTAAMSMPPSHANSSCPAGNLASSAPMSSTVTGIAMKIHTARRKAKELGEDVVLALDGAREVQRHDAVAQVTRHRVRSAAREEQRHDKR